MFQNVNSQISDHATALGQSYAESTGTAIRCLRFFTQTIQPDPRASFLHV
jgi:hypothetical protein